MLYLGCAAFFFGLAVLGMILPLVPATPFLLVTSYFLVRSFPKLNDRLLDMPYFGPILYDWEVRKGMKTSVKIQAIATVVLGWGISICFFPVPLWALVLMAVLVAIGIAVIYRIPKPRELVEVSSEEPQRKYLDSENPYASPQEIDSLPKDPRT